MRRHQAVLLQQTVIPPGLPVALLQPVKFHRRGSAVREHLDHASPNLLSTATKSVQTQSLLTGLLKCAVCGGNFAARPVHTKRGSGQYSYYGCGVRARRGTSVCQNATLLPQEAIERELLELLLQAVFTPATLNRVLAAVNVRLRAQAQVSRPRIKELRRALSLVDREIANYTRAIGKGDFSSLDQALGAAEQRRTTLQGELARLNGNQEPAVVQLTPAALERHLQGMTEKLRSGVNGKVREAIQQSIARILVGGDGGLTIEAKTGGLLGLEGNVAQVEGQGQSLLEHDLVSPAGRQWKVITAA